MKNMRPYVILSLAVACLFFPRSTHLTNDEEAERWVVQGRRLLTGADDAAALHLFQDALLQFRASRNRKNEGHVFIDIGVAYGRQHATQNAVASFEQARRILHEIQDVSGEANALLKMGHLLREQGEFWRALDIYQDAAALVGDSPQNGVFWGNIGTVYTELGQSWEAFRFYQRALAFLQNEQNSSRERGTILLGMGINDARLERNNEALLSLRNALTLFQESGDQNNAARALTAIGGVYDAKGRDALQLYFDAFEAYRQALQIFQERPNSNDLANLLNNIGLAYARLAFQAGIPVNYRKAEEYYRQSFAIAQHTGNHAMQAKTLTHLAEMQLDLCWFEEQEEHLQEAGRLLEEALRLQRAMRDQGNVWLTFSLSGRMHEFRGEKQAALARYREALDALEIALAAAGNTEFQTNLSNRDEAAQAYQRAMLLLMRQHSTEASVQAFEVSERARARAFLDQLGNLRPKTPRTLSPQLLELQQQETALQREVAELSARIGRTDAQGTRALQAQLEEKRQEYLARLEQIDAADPEYASLRHVIPPQLAEIQAQIAPAMTLLSYVVTPEATLAFVITRETFQAVALPAREDRLFELVSKVRRSPQSLSASQELWRVLFAPLEPHLRTPTLAIIPHGMLHYLPFAAVHDGRAYLNDRYALLTLPSAAALNFLPAKPLPHHPSLLALANAHAVGKRPALGGAADEARSIGENWRLNGRYQADVYVSEGGDSNATETRVQQDAGKYDILHLAAHGVFEPSSPLFSALLLSADAENDGRLNAHEIYHLDLRQTTLVVLSACETSLGRRSRGDEIIGVSRAFMHAGTPSVIASLWKVSDRATQQFMTHFYRELAVSKNKAEALRSAQRLTRAHDPNPRDWAGFVLLGRP